MMIKEKEGLYERFYEVVESASIIMNIEPEDVVSRRRKRELVTARSICCVIFLKICRISYARLASFIKRDHSSVCYYLKSHDDLYDVDVDYRSAYDKLFEIYKDGIPRKRLSPLEFYIKQNQELKKEFEKLKELIES